MEKPLPTPSSTASIDDNPSLYEQQPLTSNIFDSDFIKSNISFPSVPVKSIKEKKKAIASLFEDTDDMEPSESKAVADILTPFTPAAAEVKTVPSVSKKVDLLNLFGDDDPFASLPPTKSGPRTGRKSTKMGLDSTASLPLIKDGRSVVRRPSESTLSLPGSENDTASPRPSSNTMAGSPLQPQQPKLGQSDHKTNEPNRSVETNSESIEDRLLFGSDQAISIFPISSSSAVESVESLTLSVSDLDLNRPWSLLSNIKKGQPRRRVRPPSQNLKTTSPPSTRPAMGTNTGTPSKKDILKNLFD